MLTECWLLWSMTGQPTREVQLGVHEVQQLLELLVLLLVLHVAVLAHVRELHQIQAHVLHRLRDQRNRPRKGVAVVQHELVFVGEEVLHHLDLVVLVSPP